MKEDAEQEKALFLNVCGNFAQVGTLSKGRPTEAHYDFCKSCKKKPRNPEKSKLFFLSTVCDHILVVTVVIVNVVGYWRGLFGIFSQFRDLYHLLFLYLSGSIIICHFTIARNSYKRHLQGNNIYSFVLRKGYTYAFGCACIAQWAGLWYFLDAMSGFDVYPPLAYSAITSAILISVKLYRNVLAPPITFCTDRLDDFFEFPTVFKIDPPKELEVLKVQGLRLHPVANTCDRLEGKVHLVESTWTLGVGSDHSPPVLKRIIDALLSSIVIAPAVIAYWRGTWYLSDFYVFPQKLYLNLIVSTVVGTLVQLIFSFSQEFLKKTFHPDKHRIIYYASSRFYTYLYSVACVNLWRGGWKALDFYSGTDSAQVVIPTAVSIIVLLGMKAVRNLSSAPLAVVLDKPTDYFCVPTMFKLTGTSDSSLYILDCFFSVFVIGSLVVFVWRGVWCLTDVFLYPENDKFSAFGSLAIGYGIIIVVFSIQTPMEGLCEKLEGFWRLLVADTYVFVSFIGTINLWRGIWNLLNIYFLPESPILSCWITHLGSFVFLVLINCSNSTLVRGVYLDGEEGGKCVAFPISYLGVIFKKHLVKKRMKNETNDTKRSKVDEDACGDVEKGQKENSEKGKTLIQANEVKS